MTQSKYLITTTNTPNSIVKRNQTGDIDGNSIFLQDQLVASSVVIFDSLDVASSALFLDGLGATFQVAILADTQNVSCQKLIAGFDGISSAGVITGGYIDSGNITGTADLDFNLYTAVQVTPTGSTTISSSVCPPAGTFCYLIVKTTGSVSRTLTFNGSNFRTTGTLATGVNGGRTLIMSFISDGVELCEVSRTSAMVQGLKMAITSGQISAGTTRQQIDGTSTNPFRLHIHNNEATTTLYVGNQDVTIDNGLRLESKDSLEIQMNPGESIYIVSTTNNHDVSWLRQDS